MGHTEIMNPLKKLNYKLGGLLKLAFWGPSPGHANSDSVNHAETDYADALEAQDLDGMNRDQVESFALDEREGRPSDERGRLKNPEYMTRRYDKLPSYATTPALYPQYENINAGISDWSGHQNVSQNLNLPGNKYMDHINPLTYSTRPMNTPSLSGTPGGTKVNLDGRTAFRSNSMDAGRDGILVPYTGMMGNKRPNQKNPYEVTEFIANPDAISSSDQRKLNQKYMMRKDPTEAAGNHNSVATKREGKNIKMVDPVANRYNHMNKMLNLKGTA